MANFKHHLVEEADIKPASFSKCKILTSKHKSVETS